MPKTFKEYCADMREKVQQITNAEFKAMSPAKVIDVRSADRYAEARIPGAINIPKQVVEMKMEDICNSPDEEIVVYCGGGSNSSLVCRNLAEMGYTRVYSLQTGIKGWINDGNDVESG